MRAMRLFTAAATLSLAGGIAAATGPAAGASSLAAGSHAVASMPAGPQRETSCQYTITASHIRTWHKPGGSATHGNHATGTTRRGDTFLSQPYRTSGVVHGQRWIYGVELYTGSIGWVGRHYLHLTGCFPTNRRR